MSILTGSERDYMQLENPSQFSYITGKLNNIFKDLKENFNSDSLRAEIRAI